MIHHLCPLTHQPSSQSIPLQGQTFQTSASQAGKQLFYRHCLSFDHDNHHDYHEHHHDDHEHDDDHDHHDDHLDQVEQKGGRHNGSAVEQRIVRLI